MFLKGFEETGIVGLVRFAGEVSSLAEFRAAIFDIGSANFRLGYSGEDAPRKTFRNAVSRRKYPIAISFGDINDVYIDDTNALKSGAFTLSWPVHHGVVKNWDDFEKVLSYGVRSVKVGMEEHQCLICTSPTADLTQKEKMAEIFLETFSVPSLSYQATDALSLLGHKKTTGLVVESGEGITTVSAFVNSYKLVLASTSVRVGGKSVTSYLLEKIRDDKLTGSTGWAVAEEIKEKECYVPMDYAAEIQDAKAGKINVDVRMPNGSVKVLGAERIKAGDFMFRPRIWGLEMPGIHEMVRNAIRRCKPDDRNSLWESIVLAGGNTMMKGFVERFRKEMEQIAPKGVKVGVIADERREIAPFAGASLVAGIQAFSQISVTREEYAETGKEVIAQKCS